jgi:hypothetical protein
MVIDMRRSERDREIGRRYRCLLNGRDVTNDTFYADGRRGIVGMYLRDDAGRFLFSDGWRDEVGKVFKRGRVRLMKKVPA